MLLVVFPGSTAVRSHEKDKGFAHTTVRPANGEPAQLIDFFEFEIHLHRASKEGTFCSVFGGWLSIVCCWLVVVVCLLVHCRVASFETLLLKCEPTSISYSVNESRPLGTLKNCKQGLSRINSDDVGKCHGEPTCKQLFLSYFVALVQLHIFLTQHTPQT